MYFSILFLFVIVVYNHELIKVIAVVVVVVVNVICERPTNSYQRISIRNVLWCYGNMGYVVYFEFLLF